MNLGAYSPVALCIQVAGGGLWGLELRCPGGHGKEVGGFSWVRTVSCLSKSSGSADGCVGPSHTNPGGLDSLKSTES